MLLGVRWLAASRLELVNGNELIGCLRSGTKIFGVERASHGGILVPLMIARPSAKTVISYGETPN